MDKSYKVTESQRDFIGSKFPTPRGGELTITGVVTSKDGLSKNNTDCRFSAVCSLCSLDVELFPEEFIVVKCSLIKGCVPCGCSSQCKWSENQYFVRVKRECYSRGYEFLGWAGNFNGSKTKLKLYNPVTDNLWSSTTISKLFCGRGDPKIRTEVVKKARLKPHEVHIQDFYKAGFSKGYIFWKSELLDSRNGKPYWNYTCPYCSKDEFVESGVCSGVFTNTTSNLKKVSYLVGVPKGIGGLKNRGNIRLIKYVKRKV